MNKLWYDLFLEELYKKFPKKSQLTKALMDLLSIEREAVYRRLRKIILFPAQELAKIAATWNISLDGIIGIDTHQTSFKGKFLHYLEPTEEDLKYMNKLLQDLSNAVNDPNMEYMEVSNELPLFLIARFPYLSRYYLLKWMYQFASNEVLPFSQVFFSEKVEEFSLTYHEDSKKLAKTIFIWDPMLFEFLVSNVRYFYSIYLITTEEKKLIKKDIYTLLDYMSEVATKGCWPETGKKVYLYISHINIETNYNYYYSEEAKLCSILAFANNEMHTIDSGVADNFRKWMLSKKRASVQISEADEKSRIAFFKKQRELIDRL